jgi:hypothetical protein
MAELTSSTSVADTMTPAADFFLYSKGAMARMRSLGSVLKQPLYKDGIKVARKSTTTLNNVAQDHFKIKKARDEAIAARNAPDCPVLNSLRVIRFSSWEGVKKARKRKRDIITGRVIDENGVPTLHVVQSALERDITHNKSVRRAIQGHGHPREAQVPGFAARYAPASGHD